MNTTLINGVVLVFLIKIVVAIIQYTHNSPQRAEGNIASPTPTPGIVRISTTQKLKARTRIRSTVYKPAEPRAREWRPGEKVI